MKRWMDTLKNIELEYETKDNQDLSQESSSKYDLRRSLVYEHITHVKRQKDFSDTVRKILSSLSKVFTKTALR